MRVLLVVCAVALLTSLYRENGAAPPRTGHDRVLRIERHTEAFWSLAVADSGTASVTVELHGQPRLAGRKFELSKRVDRRVPRKR